MFLWKRRYGDDHLLFDVRQAESLSRSANWKAAADELKKLQEQWKQIRSAGKDHEESLWQRFRSAQDDFYRHRSEHFEKERRQREDNLRRKEQLCSNSESLTHSSDSKAAIERIKQIQAEWKSIGPVPRELSSAFVIDRKTHTEALWTRFRRACDQVFENAKKERELKQAEWEKRNRERVDNLRNKERLCSAAESLAHSSDPQDAIGKAKELQAEWKSIGPVPKEHADSL